MNNSSVVLENFYLSDNDSDELTHEDLVRLNPIRDGLYVVIPLTLLYSIIFITGLVGNVITCVVIHKNKNMHTATNYYLFSLAVSDLLLLFSGEF
jgi:neuromedin U receptor 1